MTEMPLVTPTTIVETIQPATNTAAASGALAIEEDLEDMRRWNEVIDNQLLELALNPGDFEDDGLVAPSPIAINHAARIAIDLRDVKWHAPTRICPTGDGGIAFEWREPDAYVMLDIGADGTRVLTRIAGGVLQFQEQYE